MSRAALPVGAQGRTLSDHGRQVIAAVLICVAFAAIALAAFEPSPPDRAAAAPLPTERRPAVQPAADVAQPPFAGARP